MGSVKKKRKWVAQQLGLKLSGESLSLASFLQRLAKDPGDLRDEKHDRQRQLVDARRDELE